MTDDIMEDEDVVVIMTTPKFAIGSIVAFVEDEAQVAMVRGFSSDDGTWLYSLTHPIDGVQNIEEKFLVARLIDGGTLQRFAELYLLVAQTSYRKIIESKELEVGMKLTQYSDTHDTVITHRVVGGSGYGANSVSLEGDDLLSLTDTAKWDVYKRQQLAPKQLTRYRG